LARISFEIVHGKGWGTELLPDKAESSKKWAKTKKGDSEDKKGQGDYYYGT